MLYDSIYSILKKANLQKYKIGGWQSGFRNGVEEVILSNTVTGCNRDGGDGGNALLP